MAVNKTELQMKVIDRVKELRTQHSLSQQQLASILDITNGQVGNIESLKYSHKYTLRQLSKIAKHFAIPVDTFFLKKGETALNTEECIDRICEYLEGE